MKRWLTLGLCLAAAAAGTATQAAQTPGDQTAALDLYIQLKQAGDEIPAWLNDLINPPAQAGNPADRDGGETMATATPITFTPGGTYFDSGTTAGKANDYNSDVPGIYCNYGSFYTSSFGSADVFYSFTLTDFYTVSADICAGGTWDTAIGILDSSGTLVAYNDDNSAVCTSSTLRSAIQACCLPAGTYYIVVDAYSTGSGTYDLNVSFSADTCVLPCTTYNAAIQTLTAPGVVTGNTTGAPNVYAGASGDQGVDITGRLPVHGQPLRRRHAHRLQHQRHLRRVHRRRPPA